MVQRSWPEAGDDRETSETRPGQPSRIEVGSCGRCCNAGTNPRAEETPATCRRNAELYAERKQACQKENERGHSGDYQVIGKRWRLGRPPEKDRRSFTG